MALKVKEVDNGRPGCDEYSYDEAMELTGNGWYNYLLLAACSIISNAVGLDMFGFSVVVTAATCDLQLGIAEVGLLTSIPLAGIIFAFLWGYFADIYGRRRALLLCTSGGFTFAALSSLAPTWKIMLVLKLLGCMFSTPAYTLTMTYLGECTGRMRRSRYLFIMNSVNLAGDGLFYLLAYFLKLDFKLPVPWLSITYRPWRLYTFILAMPLGIGALMMLLLRESPKFLASRGEVDKALEVLRVMYERNGGKREEYQVKSISTHNIEARSTESFWSSVVKQTAPLFRPPLLWRTVQLFYLLVICCTVNNVFLMWYPMMVNLFFNSFSDDFNDDKNFCQRVVGNISTSSIDSDNSTCNDTISTNTIYSGMALGVVLASLNLVASTVASWRRLVLITTYLVPAVCLVLVNLLRDPVVDLVMFTLVQMTAVGIGCVASYFVDLYPTSCRGLVTCLAVMVSRFVSLGAVNIVGAVIIDHCLVTYYFWTVVACSGIVVALFLPSDKTLHNDK